MRLLQYLLRLPFTILAFFYRLLRDWWYKKWQKIRPAVVHLFGWGFLAVVVLLLLWVAPELAGAVLNLIFAIAVLIGVIYFSLNGLPGGGKKKKRKK